MGSPPGHQGLCRSETLRSLPGRMAPRWTRSALDSEGNRRETGVRLRNGRYYRDSEKPRGTGGLSDRLRDLQRHASRRAFSERVQLADARAVGTAPIALVR